MKKILSLILATALLTSTTALSACAMKKSIKLELKDPQKSSHPNWCWANASRDIVNYIKFENLNETNYISQEDFVKKSGDLEELKDKDKERRGNAYNMYYGIKKCLQNKINFFAATNSLSDGVMFKTSIEIPENLENFISKMFKTIIKENPPCSIADKAKFLKFDLPISLNQQNIDFKKFISKFTKQDQTHFKELTDIQVEKIPIKSTCCNYMLENILLEKKIPIMIIVKYQESKKFKNVIYYTQKENEFKYDSGLDTDFTTFTADTAHCVIIYGVDFDNDLVFIRDVGTGINFTMTINQLNKTAFQFLWVEV